MFDFWLGNRSSLISNVYLGNIWISKIDLEWVKIKMHFFPLVMPPRFCLLIQSLFGDVKLNIPCKFLWLLRKDVSVLRCICHFCGWQFLFIWYGTRALPSFIAFLVVYLLAIFKLIGINMHEYSSNHIHQRYKLHPSSFSPSARSNFPVLIIKSGPALDREQVIN